MIIYCCIGLFLLIKVHLHAILVSFCLYTNVAFSADVRKFSSCFCRVLTRSDEMFVFSRTTWKYSDELKVSQNNFIYAQKLSIIDKKGFMFCCISIIVFTLFTQNWCEMLVIIWFKCIFKFFMRGHAWVNFRVLTRWKCFTQNTIFKLILKLYEFSLKFHAERIQHNAGRPKNYIELDLYPALRGSTQIKEEVFVFQIQCTTQCIFFCTYQARQTWQNSGGVAEGHPRFNKGRVAIIFYFLRVKNRTF